MSSVILHGSQPIALQYFRRLVLTTGEITGAYEGVAYKKKLCIAHTMLYLHTRIARYP